MDSRELSARRKRKSKQKSKKGLLFLWILATLFFVSFASSAYIIIYANQLTFGGGNLTELQQQVQDLKSELAKKDSQIEELKLKVANSGSSSHFTNSYVAPSQTQKPSPTASPKATEKPSPSPAPTGTPKPTETPAVTQSPIPTSTPDMDNISDNTEAEQ